MGSGFSQGIDRIRLATRQAISSPLLDNATLDGARGVLVNITTARIAENVRIPLNHESG